MHFKKAATSSPRSAPLPRGFTLIELLVVIAIIAILAAILFPVFQSVRENARAADCVSNQKQIALAVIQYTNDNDEKYPFGNDGVPGEGWSTHNVFVVPPSFATPAQLGRANDFWANSIQPYLKSYDVYTCKDSTPWNALALASTTGRPNVTYTYNGELQSSSQAAVLAPTDVPLIWAGELKDAIVGYATSTPALNCPDANSPCVYQPASPDGTCAPGNGGMRSSILFGVPANTAFAHHTGDNFAYCDGHVKFVNYLIPTYPHASGTPALAPYVPQDSSGTMIVNGVYYLWQDGCGGDYGFGPDFNP